MLDLHEVSLIERSGSKEEAHLHQISAQFSTGQYVALLGAVGSGVDSLIKVLAGIIPPSSGSLSWNTPGKVRAAYPGAVSIGYIPQSYCPRDFLSVSESLEEALLVRANGLGKVERQVRIKQVLGEVGLQNVEDELVRNITDEQICRLKIGMELVEPPQVLLCENITADLDPRSEQEILKLLREVACGCLVVIAPGNLRDLELFNTIAVFHEGHLAYHGPGEFLLHYFNLSSPEGLYLRLSHRRASEWFASWNKHRAAYYSTQPNGYHPLKPPEPGQSSTPSAGERSNSTTKMLIGPPAPAKRGSALGQIRSVQARYWKEFIRRPGPLLLQLALMIGLPCLVVIFAWGALEKAAAQKDGLADLVLPGNFLSELVMFEAVLVAFAGALNSVPRIAGECFAKEKFDGLRPFCWVLSWTLGIAALAGLQSFWMAFFVGTLCHFPGDYWMHGAWLFGVNFAMAMLCSGIASFARRRENARMMVLFAAILQWPFAGTMLALPAEVSKVTRLMDPVYWGWAGIVHSFDGSWGAAGDAGWCWGVLGILAGVGFGLAWLGARRKGWGR